MRVYSSSIVATETDFQKLRNFEMMPFSVKNMHIRIVTHTHTHKLILLQREERSKTCYSMQAKWPGWDLGFDPETKSVAKGLGAYLLILYHDSNFTRIWTH